MTTVGARVIIRNSVSRNALCATGLAMSSNYATISNNTIAFNGYHHLEGLWSDGLTAGDPTDLVLINNEFIDNTDVDLIFGGCRRCLIENNTIKHSDSFVGGSFAALMIHSWPNGATSGDYLGTEFRNNQVDCSLKRRCGFGMYLGSEAWYIAKLAGGSFHNNNITNTQIGFAIDAATGPIEIYNNSVTNSGGNVYASCGLRRGYPYTISSNSVTFVNRSRDSIPQSSYIIQEWNGCIPNWWRTGELKANVQGLSGPITSRTLSVHLEPISSDIGKSGAIFIAAIVKNGYSSTMYFLNSNRQWIFYDGVNAPPALAQTTLPVTFDTLVTNKSDLSSYLGTDVYIGYGFGGTPYQEMLSTKRYSLFYTVR